MSKTESQMLPRAVKEIERSNLIAVIIFACVRYSFCWIAFLRSPTPANTFIPLAILPGSPNVTSCRTGYFLPVRITKKIANDCSRRIMLQKVNFTLYR